MLTRSARHWINIERRRLPVALFTLVVCLLSAALGHVVANGIISARAWFVGGLTIVSLHVISRYLPALVSQLTHWNVAKLLWLLLLLSSLTFRVRSSLDVVANPFDRAALLRIGLVGSAALILVLVTLAGKNDLLSPLVSGPFALLTIFGLTNIASTAWSSYPAWTLYRSIEYFVDASAAAYVAYYAKNLEKIREIFNWSWLLISTILISVILGALYAPERAIVRGLGVIGFSLEGVFPAVARNSVGQFASIIVLVSFVRLLSRNDQKLLNITLLLLSLVLLIIAQTRSAILPVLVAVPLLLILTRHWRTLLILAVVAMAIILLSSTGNVLEDYLRRGQQDDQIASLTGRVDWWQLGIHAWKDRPFSGFGAFTAGRFIVGREFSETLSSTHSTYVEVLLGTSFWGLIPLLALIATIWGSLIAEQFRLTRHANADALRLSLNSEAIAVMCVLTVRSFFSVPMIWHFPFDFLLIVIYVSYLRRRRTADNPPPIGSSQ